MMFDNFVVRILSADCFGCFGYFVLGLSTSYVRYLPPRTKGNKNLSKWPKAKINKLKSHFSPENHANMQLVFPVLNWFNL